jgi:hypothetical protein
MTSKIRHLPDVAPAFRHDDRLIEMDARLEITMTSPTDPSATVEALTGISGGRSHLNDFEQLATLAGLGWLGVAIAGVWEIAGGDWPYLLFSITLMLAAVLSVAAAWWGTREADRATLRRCGLGIGLLAAASTVVAWALPLWMTLLAVTFAVWAVAAPRALRPGLITLAAAQLVGMGAMIVAIKAEVGPQNSYGDYPAAFGVGLLVAGAGSALGLAVVARSARSRESVGR